MDNINKKNNSLILSNSNLLVKNNMLFAITDKILLERKFIWWHGLDDIWKKIFYAEIGKINDRPKIYSAEHIDNYGSIETPNKKELKEIINLKKIEYSNNFWNEGHLTDLSPLIFLKDLEILNFGCNQITDLSPLNELTNLKDLYFFHNKISDLKPLRPLKNLVALTCSKNQITDLLPLKALNRLEYLNCGKNLISDLTPLKDLNSLIHFSCGYNLIDDLTPLKNLRNLRYLTIRDNKIPREKLIEFEKFFPFEIMG